MKKVRKYPQKLFFAYSSLYLAALILLFSLTAAFFYRQQYLKSRQSQQQLVVKTAEQIDASLQSMDRIATGLLFNKTFLELMQSEDAPLHYTDYSRRILNAFTAMDAPMFSTWRIIAFRDSLYYNLSKCGESQSYIKNAAAQYAWKDEVYAANGQKLILPVHQDPFDASATMVYSVARAITDGRQIYGIIEVQNDSAQLEKLCSLGQYSGQISVFSPAGEGIYPLEGDLEMPEELSLALAEPETAPGYLVSQGNLICYSQSEYSGWLTVLSCPLEQVVPYTIVWLLSMLALFALSALGMVLAIRAVTNRLTAPLVNLNEALSRVSLDNLSLELPQQYGIEEIENINRSFLTMFSQLKASIARNVQARANEERANYLALQSQMNPHTIYNTIGMIESVSYMNGDKEVSHLCVCFSQMLRYISDYSRKVYTVRDELQHLSNYAVLIETRYAGKLKIDTQADPELLSCTLPKFTIQPLVENAVKHGYGKAQLYIQVTVAVRENGWYIRVQDNGCGFTQDRLEEIHRQLDHCDECLKENDDVVNMKIGNLALSNIYIRCRILFGPQFSFDIGNCQGNSGGFVCLSIDSEEGRNGQDISG